MNRQTLLRRAGLAAGTVAVGGAGALSYRAYDQGVFQVGQGAAYSPWADWKQHRGLIPLVAAATLAPSPHNSRPWLFRIGSDQIDVFADASRDIGAIDPYEREQFVGLGAALENLVLAAEATGYAATVSLMPNRGSSGMRRGSTSPGRPHDPSLVLPRDAARARLGHRRDRSTKGRGGRRRDDRPQLALCAHHRARGLLHPPRRDGTWRRRGCSP